MSRAFPEHSARLPAKEVNVTDCRTKASRLGVRMCGFPIEAIVSARCNLVIGFGIALVAILLLLTANFQSIKLALVVLSTAPAVLAGVALMLWITGSSLNIQSFMGTIMALGVAVANAILLVTFAEQGRREGMPALEAAMEAAKTRMHPVLMTSIAMTAGMVPMALALGSGAQATAPLGRAVIGGLLAATATTLLIIPLVFTIVQQNAKQTSVSLDPEDPESRYASPPPETA